LALCGRWLESNINEEGLLLCQGATLKLAAGSAPREQLRSGDLIAVDLDPENLGSLLRDQVLKLKTFKVIARAEKSPQNLLSSERVSLQRKWNDYLVWMREFLNGIGLEEVRTPTLVECPGLEVHLEPFATELVVGKKRLPLFLPTSPELHLKKMLAQGWSDIFEMRPCFRNGEISPHHQPEFWMLEWYRGFATLDMIESDLEELVTALAKRADIDLKDKFRRISMSELFLKHCDFKLTPQTTRGDLISLCQKLEMNFASDDTWDDLFFRIFLEKVEPFIGWEPTFVTHYPPSQAALARKDEAGWAMRFEFYYRGLEIANAYDELTDAKEQRHRFTEDQKERARLKRTQVPLDEVFLSSLETGFPPSGGIALGLERLFMAIYGIENLSALRDFPL
jgi:lysyl-tRNA synthetase class 2